MEDPQKFLVFLPFSSTGIWGDLPSGSLLVSQTGPEGMGTWPNSASYYPGDLRQAIVGFGLQLVYL